MNFPSSNAATEMSLTVNSFISGAICIFIQNNLGGCINNLAFAEELSNIVFLIPVSLNCIHVFGKIDSSIHPGFLLIGLFV